MTSRNVTNAIGHQSGTLDRLWRLATSNTALAFADQCAVSGLAFAALTLTGTFSDLAQLGGFALAMSLIALALATQDAIITRPYSVQIHTAIGQTQAHLHASFRLSAGFTGMAFLLATAAGGILTLAGHHGEALIAWALALALPGILLREFGRRVSFAHERSIEAFLLDVPVAGAALAGILALGVAGQLTAATALLVLGAANLAGALCWLGAKGLNRRRTGITAAKVAAANWLMGRWLLLCQILMQTQGYTTHWLALIFLGTSATGLYAASISLVALANPVLYGLFNVMSPRSARVFRQQGNQGVFRGAVQDATLLVCLMLGFCVLVALFGQSVVAALYPEVGDTRHLLIVLAFSALVGSAGVPAAMALTSAHKARELALVVALAAFVNLAAVLLVLPWGGLLGAAYGTLLAEFAGAAGRWIALRRSVGDDRAAIPAPSPDRAKHT